VKTSLIIPAYFANQRLINLTAECLHSLDASQRPDEVILVDDGGIPDETDNYGAEFRHLLDNYIKLDTNSGYCKAVNAGLKEATGDVLIVGNNDITFLDGWLDAIMLPIQMGADISMIRVSDSDGWEIEQKMSEGDKFGSLFAMTRKTYDTLGGFDEHNFRGYFSDLDYRKRAQDAGLSIVKNHAAVVGHLGGKTYKTVRDKVDFIAGKQAYMRKWGVKTVE